MLRIHFSADDLARTRFAAEADSLWELSLSMHQLRLPSQELLLAPWRRQVASKLHPAGNLAGQVALPMALNPPRGYFPDFLTPYEATNGFEAGLEAILATPAVRLRQEISQLDASPSWLAPAVAGICAGEAGVMSGLGDALRLYHEVAIAPVWDRISTAVDADRRRRMHILALGGWAQLFNTLHPCARYEAGVLEISVWGSSRDLDLHLDGRGLLLVPSYFKESRQLMVLADVGLPPVLVYPVDPLVRVRSEAGSGPVTDLIGRTRAGVLEVAGGGGTTSQIAKQINISLPAASKHLAVLKRAGLVISSRDQNTVFHTLTPLGEALLAGAAPAAGVKAT